MKGRMEFSNIFAASPSCCGRLSMTRWSFVCLMEFTLHSVLLQGVRQISQLAQCVTAGGQADLTTCTILTGSYGHISKRGVNDLFQLKHIEILMTSVLS